MMTYQRFGGELPDGADGNPAAPRALPPNTFCFSHGRAALAWLLQRRAEPRWVMHCAYTCPTVPRFFEQAGIECRVFDVGASLPAVAAQTMSLPGAGMVLVPALFGRNPWLDAGALSDAVYDGGRVRVVIDAAQTAFGHEDYEPPAGGAVLSCPRKACALGGGAVLRLGFDASAQDRASFEALPEGVRAAALKRSARALFQTRGSGDEDKGLQLATESEAGWPDAPHRMDAEDLARLMAVDGDRHRRKRRQNASRLDAALTSRGLGQQTLARPDESAGRGGVPFNFPVLLPGSVDRRSLLASLRERRVFATALWPDSVFDQGLAPLSADYRERLIALPIDQRFDEDDMEILADKVASCLSI